jgi:type VI secretion system secreted protein VgrG
MLEDLIQDLVDRLDRGYVGKYRGVVHDNADPEHRGRIQAIVPRLLGPTTPTGWALPAAPYAGPDQGFFTVPDKGAAVWIEFEEGDLSSPIWSGGFWGAPQAGDVGQDDSTARVVPRPAAVGGDAGAQVATPETPQHAYPAETPAPSVRILKSATGHHIVLDDRPDSERIEIHDSRGNRVIFSKDGMEQIVSNERTVNSGSRSVQVDRDDKLEVSGAQRETVGGGHTRHVAGDLTLRIGGNLSETVAGTAYVRTVNEEGTAVSIGSGLTETIGGGVTRSVGGAVDDTVVGGYGLTTAGSVNIAAAGPVKLAAGLPDLTLTAFAVDALAGNLSLNTKLGLMQLGGLGALSPLVLGDGLAIHFTLLAQILKVVNPLTVSAYGPALDAWAAMTPALDLSYFAFVKRFPVG